MNTTKSQPAVCIVMLAAGLGAAATGAILCLAKGEILLGAGLGVLALFVAWGLMNTILES